MKLPPYPLQAVFDLRDRERDEAQELLARRIAEQAEAEAALSAAEERVAALRCRSSELESALYEPPVDGTPLDVREIDRRQAELEFLDKRIEEAERQREERARDVERAVAAVAVAKQELTAAFQALKAIERHHERWRDELLDEMRKKEEKMIQEIAASAFVRRRSS